MGEVWKGSKPAQEAILTQTGLCLNNSLDGDSPQYKAETQESGKTISKDLKTVNVMETISSPNIVKSEDINQREVPTEEKFSETNKMKFMDKKFQLSRLKPSM